MLKDVELKRVYTSDNSDLVNEFFNPVLESAVQYDRVTGYFSPRVLALAARGFSKLLARGGKIRVITSVQVDTETYNTLRNYHGSISERLSQIDEIKLFDPSDLSDELQKDYLRIFLSLIKTGLLELKIAVVDSKKGGIFHEKIGIVIDEDGNGLSFSGSNNETPSGWGRNIEQFKVFTNWNIATVEFFNQDKMQFDEYWSGKSKATVVLDIDEAFKRDVLKINELDEDFQDIARRISITEKATKVIKACDERKPHPYQLEAISHWKDHGYMSVFEMATGTGKTFTSILALKEFREDNGSLRGVVVVPLLTLVIQWADELKSSLPGVTVIIVSGININWRDQVSNLIASRRLGVDVDYVLVTTYATFSSDAFNGYIDQMPDKLTLLADEMHNMVTESNLRSASNQVYAYRLGLSATPVRLWKQEESQVALKLFGDNSYVYSLEKAIENGFLVPYYYYPLIIHLDVEEYEEYTSLSKEISRMSSYGDDPKKDNPSYSMKLMKRSRIKKQADNKFSRLEQMLNELGGVDMRNTLIYADSNAMLERIQKILTSKFIKSTKFTGAESLDERLKTINNFRDGAVSAIVAIKCLDEGVDIPSAITGIFMSNNTDPREYIQRLGRVLRKDKLSNKDHASVYDFIVFPPVDTMNEDTIGRNLVKNELIRCKFFTELAVNGDESWWSIYESLDRYGYYFQEDELSYNNGKE